MILLMTTNPPANSPWIQSRKFPPLGLAYVAASLEKAGFNVEVIDNYNVQEPFEQLKVEIQKLNPEIMGITCGSVTYKRCIETAKLVKEILPSCKIVVGGWHPTYMPESLLKHQEIDFVIMGEGERAITELTTNIKRAEGNSSIANIPGVAYRNNGKIITNSPKLISDLDEVPFPARHLLPMHIYDRKIEYLDSEPVDTMNIIRGCPFGCTFCEVKNVWGRKCRAFSPNRVVDEINHMVKNHGTKGIYFVGDNFTIYKDNTIKICDTIKKHKIDIEWVCDTRVDLISRELLRKMKDAGCKTVWFGVESGSPRILEKINRGVTTKQIDHAFKLCREVGLHTACSFMLGIPGETTKDMKASFKFARKIDPDWCRFNIFIAVPGSDLYDEVMQKGLYNRLEDYVAYVKTENFNYESLLEVQKRFHKSFNITPKRILKKIRQDGFLPLVKRTLKSL